MHTHYMKILLIGGIILLLMVLYYGKTGNQEGFAPRCPNLLFQRGSRYYLYNSKLAKVPGVNPISFEHLEEYTEFLEWQKAQGIVCPVLYLQHGINAQGDDTYTVRPSVSNLNAGATPQAMFSI